LGKSGSDANERKIIPAFCFHFLRAFSLEGYHRLEKEKEIAIALAAALGYRDEVKLN
jgi:hypothetical protein